MWLRWCEFFALFWGIPCILYIYRASLGQLLLPLIGLVALCCCRYLWRDGILQRQWQLAKEFEWHMLKPVLRVFVPLALLSSIFIILVMPERFLDIPLAWTGGWLMLLLMYPIFSVIPQELIFRTFFFHRYRRLFPRRMTRVLISSLSFGFAHLLYANWIAVVLSFFGGILFGYRFVHSGSTAVVIVEHSLWGCFLFTAGLGSYFLVSGVI